VVFLVLPALGSAAALFPIKHPNFPIMYIWFLGGAILLVFILSLDGEVSRTDGTITLAAYFAFMVYLVRNLWRTRSATEEIEEAEAEVDKIIKEPAWCFPLMFPGGLVGLLIGALLVIKGTRAVLHYTGIEETVLGLTLVAIGANSVELLEPVIRAKQGHPEVVIGSVAGSSFYQLLFTLEICVWIRPMQVSVLAIDGFIPTVAVSWLILMILVWHRRTSRWIGINIMASYVVFVFGAVILGMII